MRDGKTRRECVLWLTRAAVERRVAPLTIRAGPVGDLALGRYLATAVSLALLLFVFPATAQVSLPAGLYVRGDLGAGFAQGLKFRDADPNAPQGCDLCTDLFPSSTGNGLLFGAGAGYRLSPLFRADLTVDYLTPVRVIGHSTATPPSTGSANLELIVGLVNGYVDLADAFPNWFGPLQPYVSAGVGVARNRLGTTTGVSGLLGPFTIGGASRTNFAWALGAGAGYALTPRLTIDLAYKYLDRGEVRTNATVTALGTAFQLTPSKTGDFNVHTVTLGLRYGFRAAGRAADAQSDVKN